MRAIVGSILILASAVLISAGIVADAVAKYAGGHGDPGFVLGGIVGLVGIFVFFKGGLKRAWDSIPTEEKKSSS